MTDRLEHASDLPVAALGNGDPVPAVGPVTATILDGAELRHAVVELDAIEQTAFLLVGQGAQHPHRVFALKPETGMHEPVGQLTRAGEQQETFGVQIQSPDGLPLAVLQSGQPAEHGRAILGVVMRSLLQDGVVKSLRGQTTLEEVLSSCHHDTGADK